MSENNVFDIQEETRIPLQDYDLILEKGDKIQIFSEAIPQEKLIRAQVWDSPSRNSISSAGKKEYGLKDEDIIGWFANAYNMGEGWLILKASDFDKREFGTDVFRTYIGRTNATSIIRFNLLTGMYAFADAQYYSDTDSVRFERMAPYNRLFIEPTPKAFEEFNII